MGPPPDPSSDDATGDDSTDPDDADDGLDGVTVSLKRFLDPERDPDEEAEDGDDLGV